MKTIGTLGVVVTIGLAFVQPVEAGWHGGGGGGGRSFGGGSHFSGGGRSYGGGAARSYGGGSSRSYGSAPRSYAGGSARTYAGGQRYNGAGRFSSGATYHNRNAGPTGSRYNPGTNFRNPTYSSNRGRFNGNRT